MSYLHNILYPCTTSALPLSSASLFLSPFTHFLFFFNDTATTEIYTLSLHDALPISWRTEIFTCTVRPRVVGGPPRGRSEEHTSELQSPMYLVCRLLLEKKKKKKKNRQN